MLFFAHVGLTLAAARVGERIAVSRGSSEAHRLIDYRLVLIGSILPDLIDKPLVSLILSQRISSGRSFFHSLVFFLLLTGVGLYLWRRYRRSGGLLLAGGVAAHYLLDFMWQEPQILFWPFYGWGFQRGYHALWINDLLGYLVHDPVTYIPEITGLLLVCFLGLLKRNELGYFLKTGKFMDGNNRR